MPQPLSPKFFTYLNETAAKIHRKNKLRNSKRLETKKRNQTIVNFNLVNSQQK
jgi:hypothetical protein